MTKATILVTYVGAEIKHIECYFQNAFYQHGFKNIIKNDNDGCLNSSVKSNILSGLEHVSII